MVPPFSCSLVLWFSGSLFLRFHGSPVPWFCSSTVLQFSSSLGLYLFSSMIIWFLVIQFSNSCYRVLTPWFFSSKVLPFPEYLVLCFHHSLVPWFPASVVLQFSSSQQTAKNGSRVEEALQTNRFHECSKKAPLPTRSDVIDVGRWSSSAKEFSGRWWL